MALAQLALLERGWIRGWIGCPRIPEPCAGSPHCVHVVNSQKTVWSLCRVSKEEQGSGKVMASLSLGCFHVSLMEQSGIDVKFPLPSPKKGAWSPWSVHA